METVLSPNDARVRLLKQKASIIEASLINKHLTEETRVFVAQYDWATLQHNLTARACQTVARALDIWYQDFVS